MAKYILHGGETKVDNNFNAAFFTELLMNIPVQGTLLCVNFACTGDKEKDKFEKDKTRISSVLRDKEVKFELAQKELFEEQIMRADAVFIRGGSPEKLLRTLRQIPDVSNLLRQNKAVAGSSAGAYALCKFYYDDIINEVAKGLGIIPVTVLAHSNDEEYYNLSIQKLKAVGLPVNLIPETQFIIIET